MLPSSASAESEIPAVPVSTTYFCTNMLARCIEHRMAKSATEAELSTACTFGHWMGAMRAGPDLFALA